MAKLYNRKCDFCKLFYKGVGVFYCSISCRNKDRKWSEEIKRKISIGNKGKYISKETKEKLRLVNLGKKLSEETKRKMSMSHFNMKLSQETKQKISIANLGNKNSLGEKNPNWKGGITPTNKKIRHSLEYKLWRESVFKRDNWTCVWCKAKNGNGKNIILHADHIKPFAYYPELRLIIDNGRTLCLPCHKKTDTYKK